MNRPDPVSFTEALRFWLKLGFISFGGPAGQIAIMHTELVERRRWISENRFLHALNYCMLLPGPEAQQLATYIGWLMHRGWGGIVAGALFVLPSLFILIALSWIYLVFGDVPVVAGLFYGIKPAVTALVLHAAHRIGTRALKNRWMWGIAAASFVAIFAFDTPFPAIVAAAGLIGWLGSKRWPQVFALGGGHGGAIKGYGPALIDDDTPTPEHAKFNTGRLVRVLAVGLVLWLLGMGALVVWQGWDATLAQMGWFFTKAALLTFGGAYAVLPYVYQGAVETFQWLSGPQMIDGLALGETTPGPLIMVVAFVGFVGGWNQAVLGPDALFAGAALAATVVTFFTFLPSFVFILAGGPLVEATHGKLGFTAPLSAITAAVVGVILNLALFFAYHVWWPQGFEGAFDAMSAAITVAAAVALFRFKTGVLPLLGVCAAAGLAFTLLR
ncbi:MAG: chromate efflux transporter [Hydrogenophaga sp.]|jgi:chromate transporter|uniref:chromate efflux transporter n=1 Tax=Hydrogenophaga sp. TaxID=1904254 RepID=UPI001DEEDB9C|nr:chromate efflux transporter [Hydrogenophaga sp.]MBW0172120.1 chromate efflux transporter [Hydrogenophaga sp.]MBW0186193.1 chromate efflux transporter [Hydrogenophaga sp.]